MISSYLKNEKGATLVIVIAFMMMLLGFMGLVLDVGNLYIERSKMQTAVDLAALAGANNLTATDSAKADEVARTIIEANKENQVTPFTIIDPDTEFYKLTVTLTKNVPTYIMHIFGTKEVSVTVRGIAQSVDEASEYTIFSNHDLEIKNTTDVKGSVYSGGGISFKGIPPNGSVIRGNVDATGTIEDALQVEAYEGYGGKKNTHVSKTMPKYPKNQCGYTFKGDKTRTIDVSKIQLDQGINVTVKAGSKLTLNLGEYNGDGTININGDGDVEITGTVQSVGSIYGNGTGTIKIKQSSFNLTGKIYVPNGKVIMACGSFTITGCLIADDIEFLEGSNNFTGPTGASVYRRTSRLIE